MREDEINKFKFEKTQSAARRTIVGLLAGSLLLMLAMVVAPTPSSARVSVGVFVNFGPPALPVYEQPYCPGPGYIWTPGYWAWDPANGYYWVPGTWVPAPFVGAMWTPGYWGFYDGGYRWNPGYWGFSVGFYGGINYGFGYTGYGYHGGYWNHDRFYYNRYVNRIDNRRIVNVYNQRVVENNHYRISYNGGRGGIDARPTRQQMAAERGRRFGPVNQQRQQEQFARNDRFQRASYNHGRPGVAATSRAGDFHGRNAVRATRAGEPYRAPVVRTGGNNQFSRTAPGRENNQRGFQSFGGPRNAQSNVRMENRNQGRVNNDRGFQSFSSPRNQQPNQRNENRAPVQRMNQQQSFRNNQPRSFERPQFQGRQQQMYRNNQPRSFDRGQFQGGQQVRRVESRPAPQQHSGGSPHQEFRGGGGGNGHGNGRGGRH